MGHPRKQRKKYNTPQHPWESSRIEEEKKLSEEYGLRNKKELWKANSIIKRFRDQAKRLISDTTEQGIKERKQLLERLSKLNLIESENIEDVLNLSIKDVLDRRLQTFVFTRGLSKTASQARQFIVHGHVSIAGKRVNVPSYLISKDEENEIGFLGTSNLSKEDHPERVKKEEKKVKKIKEAPKEKPKEVLKEKPKEEKVEVKEEVKEKENGKTKEKKSD